MKKFTDQKQRIHNNVKIDETTGCWLWQKSLDRTGYARVRYDGPGNTNGRILIHRLSYLIFNGDIPKNDEYHGTCVTHICDVRHCCAPSHLVLGTHKDNMNDMVNKKRACVRKGEIAPNAILTDAQVLEIRKKYIPYVYTQRQLSEEYNVSLSAIGMIICKSNWKHL